MIALPDPQWLINNQAVILGDVQDVPTLILDA